VPIAVTTLIKMLVVIEKPWCSVAVEQCLGQEGKHARAKQAAIVITMTKIELVGQTGVELRL